MENALDQLSASALRKLLIAEVQVFIKYLDDGSLEELKKKKIYLTEILHLITEKERQEMAPLEWGKNSTPLPVLPLFHNSFLSEDDKDLPASAGA
jgi:hypothetical protein